MDRRRRKQKEESGGDEKEAVRSYFNTKGFERWNKIYGETDDVNKVSLDIRQQIYALHGKAKQSNNSGASHSWQVQLDIRTGHAQTVEKVIGWLDGSLEGTTVCDAGCGTGSLAIPLALKASPPSLFFDLILGHLHSPGH